MTRVDDAMVRRVARAQRKAHRLYPGPVGECVASHLASMEELQAVLWPGSLTVRLLVEVEGMTEPVVEVGRAWLG